MPSSSSGTTLLDYEPATETFLEEVLAGFRAQPRSLPCKYFYDQRGSRLFDQICQLDEYYLSRAELAIMKQIASAISSGRISRRSWVCGRIYLAMNSLPSTRTIGVSV